MNLEMMARVTLILSSVLAGSFVLRRAAAATRHLLAVCGLVAALALPALTAALPSLDLPILPDRSASAGSGLERIDPLAEPARRKSTLPVGLVAQADGADRAGGALAAPVARERSSASVARSGRSTAGGFIVWASLVWALGAAAVLSRFAAGWWRIAGIARAAAPLDCPRTWRMIDQCRERLGLHTRPGVRIGPEIRVAALWGFYRPTLLLPQSATTWPAGRLRVVLLHELAHLRRRDGVALVAGRLCTAAWWFHPMAWIVDRTARRDCERACDDVVLSCGERPSSYAAHLLEIVRELPGRATAPAEALAIVGPGQFEGRVRSILHPGVKRGLSRRVAVVALALVSLVVLSVTAVRPVSRAGGPSERRAGDAAEIREVEPGVLVAQTRSKKPEKVSVSDRGDGEEVFDRAMESHQEERYEEAIRGFEEAAEAGYRSAVAIYNKACGQAQLDQAAEAVKTLRRAIEDEGFDSLELLYEDSDLDPVRRDPAFQELMEELGSDRRMRFSTRKHDRYQTAVQGYEALLEDGSAKPDEWSQAGLELLLMRDFERATDALERASAAGGATAAYNLACALSLEGEKQQALDQLERAVLAGFENDERFRNDRDLDPLRDDPRFEQIDELHYRLSLERFQHGWGGATDYSERRWAPAVREFSDFVAERPDVGRAWSNLGWALHFSRKHDRARDAFERQLELGYRPSLATYNIACTHAMEGHTDQALDWLGRAVETGEFSDGQIAHDEDLETLHGDPRFETLLDRADELNDDDWRGFHESVHEGIREGLRQVSEWLQLEANEDPDEDPEEQGRKRELPM